MINSLTTTNKISAKTIIRTLINIIEPIAVGSWISFMCFMKVGPVKNMPLAFIRSNAAYVPPVSERDLAKQSMVPVTRPARKSGRVIVLTAVNLDAERVIAAVS